MVHVQGLRCRECGREYDAAPIFTCEWCFGPLEVAYDYDAIAASITREKIAAGPAQPLALLRPAAGRGRRRGRPRHRVHAARARRPARRRARSRRGVDQERHPQPDELVQGPRRLGRAEQGARVRLQGRARARRPATSRTPSPRTRRTPGCAATCSSRPISSRARSSRPPVYGGNVVAIKGNYDDVNRLCAELAGIYEWAFVNVNMRPVLRRGLQDPRVRDRGAARLDTFPITSSCRSRAVRCSRRSARVSTSSTRSGCSTRSRTCACRARRRSAARRSRRRSSTNADTIRPVKPDTIAKSLAIGNPADGYFALDVVRTTGGGVRDGHRRRDRRRACSCSPAPRASSPRPPAA